MAHGSHHPAFAPAASAQCVPGWTTLLSGGPDGEVNALAVFDDGSGPGLFAAGTFGGAASPFELSAGVLCALVADRLDRGVPLLPARPIYLRRPDTAAPAAAKPPKPVLQS